MLPPPPYGAIYAPIRGDLFMIHNTHVLALGGAARDVAPRALGAAPRAVAGGVRGVEHVVGYCALW